jgi:hypothetical protein
MNEPNEKPKPITVEQLYADASKLSVEERELLVLMLEQNNNSGFSSPKIKQVWLDECDRRVQSIKEGKSGWVDGDQFMRDLRKSLAE